MNSVIRRAIYEFVQASVDPGQAGRLRVYPVASDLVVVSFGGLTKGADRDRFLSTAVPEYVDARPGDNAGTYPTAVVAVRSLLN